MNKIEKLYEHHYKYQGEVIVLAEGSYDPTDEAELLLKLKTISEEIQSQGELNNGTD
tara:strand:+ start:229 stop:399 length:171 start_codon:yes stop_codon:yes gene_type:complete